jgi:hypothetical protein
VNSGLIQITFPGGLKTAMELLVAGVSLLNPTQPPPGCLYLTRDTPESRYATFFCTKSGDLRIQMYTFQRERMKSVLMVDFLQRRGEIDLMAVVKKIMEWQPDILEIDARRAISSWLLKDIRREDGLRGHKVREGKLPRKSANTEFEDWAPVGYKRCPSMCDDGKLGDELECMQCGGKGFVNMDGSIVEGSI